MLAFDCSPASFFSPNCLMRSQVVEPDFFFNHNQQPIRHYYQNHHQHNHPQHTSRVARSRYYRPRRQNQQNYLENFLNQLVAQAEESEEEVEPRKPEVSTKVFNLKDSFQIQVLKDNTDFKHYLIHYKVSDSETVVYIESEVDDFAKGFRFVSSVDVGAIEWRVVNNVLVVNVPKRRAEVVVKQVVKVIQSQPSKPKQPQRKQSATPQVYFSVSSTPQPKESIVASIAVSEPKPTKISIPIEFHSSESDIVHRSQSGSRRSSTTESVKSNSRAESEESDSQQTPLSSDDEEHKLPKLTRRVSIEDVEDESLNQMDLD